MTMRRIWMFAERRVGTDAVGEEPDTALMRKFRDIGTLLLRDTSVSKSHEAVDGSSISDTVHLRYGFGRYGL